MGKRQTTLTRILNELVRCLSRVSLGLDHGKNEGPDVASVEISRDHLVEPFAITGMDWAGNISTFSDKLLGLKNLAYEDFLLGNINRDSLVDLPRRSNFARMLADIQAGVERCRERCEYFSVCGGGEPVNKLAENGSFSSSETTYCRLTKKQATDLVLDALERLPLKKTRREAVSCAELCG